MPLKLYPIPFLQTEAIRALSGEKMHTMQLMVEQERRYVEQLRQDLAGSNSPKIQQELDSAVRRLAKLEQQLQDFRRVRQLASSSMQDSIDLLFPEWPRRAKAAGLISINVVNQISININK